MNEIFLCVMLAISVVMIVTMLKIRINDPLTKMMYGYYECDVCGEVRIHKMLLNINSGEVLQADCLVCSVGEEKYNVLNDILIEHAKLEDERFKERITLWSEEE